MSTVWGRVRINGQYRPAYISDAGMFVSPCPTSSWRHISESERNTWQVRDHQHTAGRIWDDTLYAAT
jgi:hypothetical protein